MAEVVFEARGLTKTYRNGEVEVHALAGVDLDSSPASSSCCSARRASGKSTLLNILGGLDMPTSGTVRFRDHDLTDARTTAGSRPTGATTSASCSSSTT